MLLHQRYLGLTKILQCSGVRMSFYTYFISPIEKGLIWNKITHLKFFKGLNFLYPNRYEIDLIYEILNIDFDQGTTEITEVKVGGKKDICHLSLVWHILFSLQIWPLIYLQPLEQNQWLVPHLKDLFHICLDTIAQDFWMIFKVPDLG